MPGPTKHPVLRIVQLAIAATPWVLTMYAFFWLDSSGTWTSETPHRGKFSVMLLGSGMIATFLLQSYFFRRR